MATAVTKYLDKAGKAFDTEADANASDAKIANAEKVAEFIAMHYNKPTSNGRKSPAAKAAENAIFKWLGNQPVELVA